MEIRKVLKLFKKDKLSESDFQEILKAKELCELKIIELWNSQNNEEFKTLCSIYLDLATINIEKISTNEDIFELIKIIVFGYLADNSHFVKDFLNKHIEQISNLDIPEKWNSRLLRKCFQAITNLIVNKTPNDVHKTFELINELRKEQKQYEEKFLDQIKKESQPYGASELISLYHFARTIEILGQYLLKEKIDSSHYDIKNKITYHMGIAKKFACVSENMMLELLYQYFEAFGIKFIENR